MKKYNYNNVDSFELYIDENKFPQVYKVKLEELISNGMSEQEAIKFLLTTPFVMELYCDPNSGVFAVESDAVESCDIYNPYTGEEMEENDEPTMDVHHYCLYEDKSTTFDVYELEIEGVVYYIGDNQFHELINKCEENNEYMSYCVIDQHKDLISLKELEENIIGFYDIDEHTPTNEELVDFVKKNFS